MVALLEEGGPDEEPIPDRRDRGGDPHPGGGGAPAYQSPLIQDACLSQGGLDQNVYGARL